MPLAGCKLQRMWVLLGPSSVMGWRRSMRARLSAAVREMRSQEPRVYTAALPLPTVFRSSDSSGGCICLDLSPFLSQPGLQAPRHVTCPTGGSSLLVSPLFCIRAPPLCPLLRPCYLLNSTASPINQGRVCRAPEAGGAAFLGLSTRCRVAGLPQEPG